MRTDTVAHVNSRWDRVFGLTHAEGALWQAVTVQHPHSLLGDYPGWYVAWRGAGVHVSAPSSARATNTASLRAAARLGFEPYCTQLALRPPVSAGSGA